MTIRKTALVLPILLTALLSVRVVEGTDIPDLDAKIRKIKSCVEKPGGPGPDGAKMFTLLLETILQAAPQTSYPREFIENVKKAKEVTDPESRINPDGFVYLNKAYRLVNSGRDFQIPESVSDIQDMVNYTRMILASARENLKPYRFNIDACVKDLICAAVLIMTPRHGLMPVPSD